jgi:MFS family permease
MLADVIGRKPSFYITLFISSFFSILCALCFKFNYLCICVVLMSFGIGGNVPVDGTLFIELVPRINHSALALLAIFWSMV